MEMKKKSSPEIVNHIKNDVNKELKNKKKDDDFSKENNPDFSEYLEDLENWFSREIEDGTLTMAFSLSGIRAFREAGKFQRRAKNNPWAICTKSVGREDKEKYERCVQDIKKNKKSANKIDNLNGGLADSVPKKTLSKDQIQKGIKIELEHTDDPDLAKEIAMDHLVEDPKYYDHLIEMEKKHKKD